MPGVNALEAKDRAEIFRKQIESYNFINHRPDNVITTSIGVSELRADEKIDSLLVRADRAMYISKQTGKNKISLI